AGRFQHLDLEAQHISPNLVFSICARPGAALSAKIHNAGRFQHLDLEAQHISPNLVFSICARPGAALSAK
ncbi:hypothetical protein VS877_22660, partial [Salmonella enterica subsp. enterica serovar Paratyphi A]|nr:hypothetical protein [Salmonella enterica subsp. enterica serovar Paratyphi A]